jgi:hypothetical protein
MTLPGSNPLLQLQDDDDDDLFDDEEDFEREDADQEEDADESDVDDEDDDNGEDGTWYVRPDGSGRGRTLTSDNELPTLAPS